MAVSSLNFITGNQTQKLIEQIQQDVAHLRTHADLQEDDADSIEEYSTRACASDDELSISSFQMPLRRYLEETESLLDPETASGRSESITGSADDTWRLNPTITSNISQNSEEADLKAFRRMTSECTAIDRVFIHALYTVKQMPKTGTSRPPKPNRLRLYAFYKQAMEGDVDDVMERPSSIWEGEDEKTMKSIREKYDAWKSQKGLSRTEAKRRYINSLIRTMHKYASTTADSRALLDELEFVWAQVENNIAFPSQSYPMGITVLA
ncbi:acyl-CoA binding protein [Stipitochalara longipes BDJ]|nr:acyl-CoA binding protein [Stipitochalara longipes BDJ]